MVIFWPTLFARFTGRKFYSVFKVQAPYFSHDFVVCNHNALWFNMHKFDRGPRQGKSPYDIAGIDLGTDDWLTLLGYPPD